MTREVFVLEEKDGEDWVIYVDNCYRFRNIAEKHQQIQAAKGEIESRVVRYVPEEQATASQIAILNSNILALIELLTYDGARTRGEGSVLVGETLDEYRERTVE